MLSSPRRFIPQGETLNWGIKFVNVNPKSWLCDWSVLLMVQICVGINDFQINGTKYIFSTRFTQYLYLLVK